LENETPTNEINPGAGAAETAKPVGQAAPTLSVTPVPEGGVGDGTLEDQEAEADPGEEPAEFFRADVYQVNELVPTNEMGAQPSSAEHAPNPAEDNLEFPPFLRGSAGVRP
jgi:hypothetical protein